MMDIRIGLKLHKAIEDLTVGKLEHLLQLANVQLVNYKKSIANYPPTRMKNHGIPHLEKLQLAADSIQGVIDSK